MIAAITAGGRVRGPLADCIGNSVKALAPFAGATLLDAAIDAAHGAGAERIVAIGGDAVRAHCGSRVDAVIAESNDGCENISRAMACGDPGEALLLLASDMPFVRAPDVALFVARAGDADIALPLATAAAYEAAYPEAPPHITRLGRERFANGSIVFFAPGIAPRALSVSRDLFEARKSLWRMATLLGPGLLLRFATGTLLVDHIEARARTLLGVTARAVREAAPGLCYDIDSLADYRYALAYAVR